MEGREKESREERRRRRRNKRGRIRKSEYGAPTQRKANGGAVKRKKKWGEKLRRMSWWGNLRDVNNRQLTGSGTFERRFNPSQSSMVQWID